MASQIVEKSKKTAEEILKEALPNEFLISSVDKEFKTK